MLNGLKSEVQLIHNRLQKVPLKTKKKSFLKKTPKKKSSYQKNLPTKNGIESLKRKTQKKTNISLVPKLEVQSTHPL